MSAHFSGRRKPDEPAKDATGWKIQANEKKQTGRDTENRRSLFFHGTFLFVRNVLAKEVFSSKTIGSVRTSDAKLFLIKLQEDGKGYSTIKSVPGSVLQG